MYKIILVPLDRFLCAKLIMSHVEEMALRDADKIAARLEALVPYLTSIVVPDAGHVILDTTQYTITFLTNPHKNERETWSLDGAEHSPVV